MELDPQICYTAMESRDERFDGRFYISVKTTGIYCRPVCPVPCPQPHNVEYYPTAASASAAGYRPCLRCRPESAPGTSEWDAASFILGQALRLINEGYLDEANIDDLAASLNTGTRQLRRIFQTHLGASPKAVAQTRRLHFAKKLIDETALPMTEIAFSTGFSSVRRFNDVIRATYSRSPTQIRKLTKSMRNNHKDDLLHMRLNFRSPYDWPALIRFLQARAIPGVEHITPESYQRSVYMGKETGLLTITPQIEGRYLQLSVTPNLSPHLMTIVERLRRMFDLAANTNSIALHFKKHEVLAPIFKRHPGLRLPGAWDPFELSVRAILGQQISVQAANTLCGRLVQQFGEEMPLDEENNITHLFPVPQKLMDTDIAQIGMPAKRAQTIRSLAQAVHDGQLNWKTYTSLDDLVNNLKVLPGIGDWTAHYIAMRAFSEPDTFPASDLGLRKAVGKDGTAISTKALGQLAEAWKPWRAYAAMALWASLHEEV
ncbi:MAG: DNA-3-methyladenine glycosylase 2 family protein [Chloroflexi bacterium]|nr:MAG: DNA-3-methyladenine glycosylase 2 family protein [Chloroflexota bacterium]MBL1197348.1 DNA-3-methyladenine glycosylase 2 family protein [Chloroflexota bacterium]NOH14645.1 helix-turn-helix domain-containing protein [Chloroflexota bacterium]